MKTPMTCLTILFLAGFLNGGPRGSDPGAEARRGFEPPLPVVAEPASCVGTENAPPGDAEDRPGETRR